MSYSSYLYNVGYGHKNTKNQGWDLTGFTDCLQNNSEVKIEKLNFQDKYFNIDKRSKFISQKNEDE